MTKRILLHGFSTVALTCLFLNVSGCVLAVGNRGTERTLGKELVDLKEARDQGAISESDYQTQRQRLLERAQSD